MTKNCSDCMSTGDWSAGPVVACPTGYQHSVDDTTTTGYCISHAGDEHESVACLSLAKYIDPAFDCIKDWLYKIPFPALGDDIGAAAPPTPKVNYWVYELDSESEYSGSEYSNMDERENEPEPNFDEEMAKNDSEVKTIHRGYSGFDYKSESEGLESDLEIDAEFLDSQSPVNAMVPFGEFQSIALSPNFSFSHLLTTREVADLPLQPTIKCNPAIPLSYSGDYTHVIGESDKFKLNFPKRSYYVFGIGQLDDFKFTFTAPYLLDDYPIFGLGQLDDFKFTFTVPYLLNHYPIFGLGQLDDFKFTFTVPYLPNDYPKRSMEL